jgi:hypothetical protein
MSSTCEISPHEDFNRWQLNRSAQPTASRPPAYERSRVVFTKHGREPAFRTSKRPDCSKSSADDVTDRIDSVQSHPARCRSAFA